MSLKGKRFERENLRFRDLAALARSLPRRGQTLLIGIDGCSGSGKSSFASALADAIPNSSVVPADGFLVSVAGTPQLDCKRLLDEVITPLAEDRAAVYRYFSWWSDSYSADRSISPGGVVLVEGCFVLDMRLRPYFDLKIWVQCPLDVAITRCVERDGRPSKPLWEDAHKPAERSYIEKQSPFVHADVIVDGFEGVDFRGCHAFTKLNPKSAVVFH